MSEEINMIDFIKNISSKERAKMATELIGDQRGIGTGWLDEVINVRKKIRGSDNQTHAGKSGHHHTIKDGVMLLLVSMIEGEKA